MDKFPYRAHSVLAFVPGWGERGVLVGLVGGSNDTFVGYLSRFTTSRGRSGISRNPPETHQPMRGYRFRVSRIQLPNLPLRRSEPTTLRMATYLPSTTLEPHPPTYPPSEPTNPIGTATYTPSPSPPSPSPPSPGFTTPTTPTHKQRGASRLGSG
ncbi:uncharacterized protein B0H64DRAFT_190170 [Chaetomium fimeti]|uniref:Uncharacterized protein n=1 Tax=Chaetomium fimeti TaxID=1854472 RepID=A0AAE0HE11_9PEZI|nr:hypothetical protein B0H64DRAFT_190170 [Chaetomium fimeti]